MDVHRDFIIAYIAAASAEGITTFEKHRFTTYTGELRACRNWLIAHNCFDVCMESTGKYWFTVCNVLELSEQKFHIVVTHPKYVKAINQRDAAPKLVRTKFVSYAGVTLTDKLDTQC